MATLTEFRSLYEILLRFDELGALKGAHAQYLEGVQRDGVTISATPGPAVPLSLVDVADQPTLAAAIGEATKALIEAKEAAETDAAEKANTIATLRAAKDEAEKRAADYAAELAAKMLADQAPPPNEPTPEA